MKLHQKTLSNRMRTMYIVDADSPSVTIMLLVRVGSRFEQDKVAGIAHFIEHTFFKGTTKRPSSKEVAMELELLGGSSNAFTSYGYTGYYVKVPKDNAYQALEILSDMIKHALFAQEEIEKERGVIIEEIRMYEDIPRYKVDALFDELLFKGHPLGRDVAGSIATVSKIQRQDFLDFLASHYHADNMLLSVAGNIHLPKMLKAVKDAFADIKPGKQSNFVKAEKRKLPHQVHVFTKKLEQTHIVMGGFGYQREFSGKYALQVGASILSYGFGSRLFQVIRDQLGLAYYISASTQGYTEIGKYNISMGVDTKKVEVAINSVIKELAELKQGSFSDQELLRAKNYLIGTITTELETSDDLAEWYGLQELLSHKVEGIDTVVRKIRSITRADVVKVWSKILSADNLLISILGPHEKIGKLDVSPLR